MDLSPDIMILIFNYLDDYELVNTCFKSEKFNKKICNEEFWINKIHKKFGLNISDIKVYKGDKTWLLYYYYLVFNTKNKTPEDIFNTGYTNVKMNTDLIQISLLRGFNINVEEY
ncbi:unnamed protein product, partial [marine sediment metagenome]